jgi:hypothetical protein
MYEDVNAQLGWHELSSNAAFLFVKLTNEATYTKTVSFAIAGDISYDEDDFAPMASLSWNRGFRIWSPRNEIRFICRSYPLVRNVSSFWIGNLAVLPSNYWTQVAGGGVSDVDASAAFSWKSISIPGGSFVTRGIIVKFGSDEACLPILNLTFSMTSSYFTGSDPVQVIGRVASFRHSEDIRLLYVIDNDLSTLRLLDLSFTGNSSVSFSFIPSDYGIWDINHQIAFYAVNSYGDVSMPQTLMFSGIPIGESEGNSGDAGSVLGEPSISSSSSDNTESIVGPIAGVACVGLVFLIVLTLCIRHKRRSDVQDEPSVFLSNDIGAGERGMVDQVGNE